MYTVKSLHCKNNNDDKEEKVYHIILKYHTRTRSYIKDRKLFTFNKTTFLFYPNLGPRSGENKLH